jgi:hypothetical protein
MEAVFSSEASVDFQRTTQRYSPEDSTLHNHRCENLKSYIFKYAPVCGDDDDDDGDELKA